MPDEKITKRPPPPPPPPPRIIQVPPKATTITPDDAQNKLSVPAVNEADAHRTD